MSKTQDSTISETVKPTSSIHTILKNQRIISLAKISLTRQFNFIDLLCYEKYH